MFGFGDEGRASRRPGLPAALVLLAVGCAATLAMLWHPESRPTPAPDEALPFAPSCTPGTLRVQAVRGGPIEPGALLAAVLEEDAKECEFLTAHDPERDRFPVTPAARSEAETINAGVRAAICPDPSACVAPRYGATADVAVVRGALLRLGYPEADVRLAKYVGESPEGDVVYGVPLRAGAGCLVAFARMARASRRWARSDGYATTDACISDAGGSTRSSDSRALGRRAILSQVRRVDIASAGGGIRVHQLQQHRS